MRVLKPLFFLGLTFTMALAPSPATAQVKPNAGMMRFPDVSADRIVFIYGEDVWIAPRSGGMASPLASPAGEESLPRFSPDGATVAFVASYDGNEDIYTIPTEGGPAKRVTYHPSAELLCDWTKDGKLIYSSDALAGLGRQAQLFVRGVDEPIPTQLPVPYGTNGAIDASGTWLAYTPYSHDYRTWKRYRGGLASDIWLFNLQTKESKRITDFEGTDSLPMWHESTVYYLTDAGPEHRLNVWAYNTQTSERYQVTKFADDDCKFPSIGPGPDGKGEIIVQNGSGVHLVSIPSGATTSVSITVPGDRPKIRPRNIDASNFITSVSPSPNAKRVVVQARGDLWTVPVKNGTARNLTRTSGVAERYPTWSPDGRWIAFFSDATGEYELYTMQSDGSGEVKQLTRDGKHFRFNPSWSPDSKWIYFTDKAGGMYLHSLETNETKNFDRDPRASQIDVSWSHNSEWVIYARDEDLRVSKSAIWIYNVLNGTKRKLTSGFFNDSQPTFDRKGDFIYFSSSRAFNAPKYEDVGTTFIYSGTEILMALPLRPDVKSPLLSKSDEEEWSKAEGDKKPAEDKKSDEKKPEPDAKPAFKAIEIVADGIESRSFKIPAGQGAFARLAVNDKGQLIYTKNSTAEDSENPNDGTSIRLLDLSEEDPKDKTVVAGKSQFNITSDGKKLLVIEGAKSAWMVDAAPDQKLDKPISMDAMNMSVEPRSEWKQVLRDAWRIERDFFYDPNMHGVNWEGVYQHYAAMLDDCVSRRDVSFLIREMISELNVGHAYYNEGDVEQAPKANVGLLGAKFELQDNAFRLARIFQGSEWDYDARSPLIAAGVKEGEFLLAVNSIPIDPKQDPYSNFRQLANKVVTLTISSDAALDESDRKVAIRLLAGDSDLRFRSWIESKRKIVEEKSQGKVGYIYVVNTGVPGQNDLFRQFYGQINKEALIIDDRWNGGGQIPTRFIELLNRPATNFWARRDGKDWAWSPDSHQGPKCMLINGPAGSGGDMFPSLFKQNKLGKLIGTRTWGGLVGITSYPGLIDGSSVTAPSFAYYDLDGTWGIEGHGVDPDIQVIDDPALMTQGGDPQLDVAIEQMLTEIQNNGFKQPNRPAYPDRKGFGIKNEDK